MKIFVKRSGGEGREVVVGLIMHAFLEMGRWGQTVLVFLQFLVWQDRMMEES